MRTPVETPMPDLDLLDVQAWCVYWHEIERRIGAVFARAEARIRAMAQLAGLLSPDERKNSWQLAEISGDENPQSFAEWAPEALHDRLRASVTAYLHAPDAVGVIDETGFLKKSTHSAGVAQQYSGTAGRVENGQICVFLAYASCHGQTLLDRDLSPPTAWPTD